MTDMQTGEPSARKPLRLWPGVAAVAVQWLLWFVFPLVFPTVAIYGALGGVACGLAVLVWWLCFSRAPWSERLGAIVLMILAIIATRRVVHASIANGMMGNMLFFYSIPALSLALVAWAVLTRHASAAVRRLSLVGATAIACAAFTLLRTGGISGEGQSDIHWRWTPTPEERLLARGEDEPLARPSAPLAVETRKEPVDVPGGNPPPASPEPSGVKAADEPPVRAVPEEPAPPPAVPARTKPAADWPGFRGPDRNSIIRGVRIETDWSARPPVQLWRRPVGPGWSSFAVHGDLLYTQEQRGDEEVVACYRVSTGEPVWRHKDPVRFWESNGGAGPRATPTFSNGRLYTFGATGLLNALDAGSGAVLWSRNVAADSDTKVPVWGFSSSPLLVDDLVIVAASGKLAAYELATGHPRWIGPARGASYSSPHLVTIAGVPQVLLLSSDGAASFAPADGTILWEHAWEGGAIVQPNLTAEGDVLINALAATGGLGTRRLAITHPSGGWSVEERWTSTGLKPYFNDFVVHEGHAFGFDGSILSCIDLQDGQRKWKGGRYGNGQLVLLPDQDLLLVLSEDGELALVSATPDKFTEIARVPAIEGKTWNHPVLVGDVLLARNGEEMAAFRLPLAAARESESSRR